MHKIKPHDIGILALRPATLSLTTNTSLKEKCSSSSVTLSNINQHTQTIIRMQNLQYVFVVCSFLAAILHHYSILLHNSLISCVKLQVPQLLLQLTTWSHYGINTSGYSSSQSYAFFNVAIGCKITLRQQTLCMSFYNKKNI